MKTVLQLLTEEFEKAFEKCGYDKRYAKVNLSNRPDLCEYQCSGAMAATKEYHKAPFMIADEIVAELGGSNTFESVESVKPGFINIKINEAYIADFIDKMAADDKLGAQIHEKPKTIVIDYGGANVAKPLHVGHLRPAIIGEALKRICRYVGDTVIGDVHMGDWGMPMGLVIEQIHDNMPDLPYFNIALADKFIDESYCDSLDTPFTVSELESIYPYASKRSKEDEVFRERAHTATLKLQEGYAPYRALWKKIMKISVADLKKNYANLGVSFDLWLGESDADPLIAPMIDDFIKRGYAHESQGALVVDVAKDDDTKEIPPCIIRKSDGAALYATSDLATIIERMKDYHPDMIVYVVDKRQDMHFCQVFRTAKKTGIVDEDTVLSYQGFGTMNGKDGKPFKTRDGGVMRLEMLLNDINGAVYDRMMENRTISEEEARETSKIVGLAALKYGDLSNQTTKDYIFDIEKFTSFEGNTGPYILYTVVRIKSILAKYETLGRDASKYGNHINKSQSATEKALLIELSKFNEMIESAYVELAPNKICSYMYNVANAFNTFYHDNKIVAEEDEKKQAGYISLLLVTKRTLLTCMDMLGFTAPDRM